MPNPQVSEIRREPACRRNEFMLRKPAADGVVGKRTGDPDSSLFRGNRRPIRFFTPVVNEHFSNNQSFGLVNIAADIPMQHYDSLSR